MKAFSGLGPGTPPDPARVRQVKEWVRQAFSLDDTVVVIAAEVACTEDGCPPIETVIGIMAEEGRVEHRLHLRIADITPAHLWQLAAGDHGCCR